MLVIIGFMLVVVFYLELIRAFFPTLERLINVALARVKTSKLNKIKDRLSSRTVPNLMEEEGSSQRTNNSKREDVVNINKDLYEDETERCEFPEQASAEYIQDLSHGKSTISLRDILDFKFEAEVEDEGERQDENQEENQKFSDN